MPSIVTPTGHRLGESIDRQPAVDARTRRLSLARGVHNHYRSFGRGVGGGVEISFGVENDAGTAAGSTEREQTRRTVDHRYRHAVRAHSFVLDLNLRCALSGRC